MQHTLAEQLANSRPLPGPQLAQDHARMAVPFHPRCQRSRTVRPYSCCSDRGVMASIRIVGPYDRKAHAGVIRKMITRSSSPVGNPFEIGIDGDRDEVCKRFEELVWIDWEVNCEAPTAVMAWMQQRINEHRKGIDLELCCRCRPKARADVSCHGETLRDWILWSAAQQEHAERHVHCSTAIAHISQEQGMRFQRILRYSCSGRILGWMHF